VTPPDNRNSQQSQSGQPRQQNLSGQTQNSSVQNRASNQNLSGQTRESGASATGTQGRASSQNLSGESERGTGARNRFGGGGFQQTGGFEQLENDRTARTQGAQRQERFGAMEGRGGGGGRFRR